MPTVQVKAPKLHNTQNIVRQHPARFKVLACGRRWGKTRLGSILCIDVASRGGRSWWVAPSYKVARVGWRLITRLGAQIPGAEIRQGEQIVYLPGGGEVAVRSADNPDSLRGEGLNLVVMDECAFVKEAAWTEALRPALSDRLGAAVFISTPKGRNWFWRMFTAGQDDGRPDYAAWQLPTTDNPYIDAGEVEAARRSLPERIYQQEYLAQFLDDAGGVFRNVPGCVGAEQLSRPNGGRNYVFGVDWGKLNDFTVITAVELETGNVVAIDRFNQIDYNFQLARLESLYNVFRPVSIIAESNSMGEALIDNLHRRGLPVRPFKTTNSTKDAIIQALSIAFERGEIGIPDDPVLINELQSFEAERLPSGLMRYSAPAGMHDDMVMSLALAWQGVAIGQSEFTANPFYE